MSELLSSYMMQSMARKMRARPFPLLDIALRRTIPPMHSGRCLVLLLPMAALLACGSSPPASSAPTTYNLTGNWEVLDPDPAQSLSSILHFNGALQFNGSTVTGTFLSIATNPTGTCPTFTTDLAVAGTLDASNNLTLTIPIYGGVATITATLAPDPQTFTPGSLQIAGGTCSMPASSINIVQFAPVTGTYFGMLTTSGRNPVKADITEVLVESTTPNSDGLFPLTGTMTIRGPCAETTPLVSETVSGNSIYLITGSSTSPVYELIGDLPTPSASSIQLYLDIYDANCSISGLQGFLNRQ